MENYEKEHWVSLYQCALIELEQAKIAGRINAAQKAIVARVQQLSTMPELHSEERRAIQDAMRALEGLQREAASFDAEAERHAIDETLRSVRSVGPAVKRVAEGAEPE
jgi:hypothetical protein